MKKKKNKYKHGKNAISIIVIILVCIIFAAGLGFLIYLIAKNYDTSNPDNIKNIISELSSLFTCVIASTSLIATLIIRKNTVKEKMLETQKNTEYYWFKTLVLDEYLNEIASFYKLCNSLLDKHKELNSDISTSSSHVDYLKTIKTDIMQPFNAKFIELQ